MLEIFILGLIIGLTGALAPGPTLVAAITSSLSRGWRAGPQITLGHMVIESALVVLIVLGIGAAPATGQWSTLIAVIGGVALIVFGGLTIRGSRTARIDGTGYEGVENPYVAGFLTSAANPYFWVWWFTVGSALFISALEGGVILALVFLLGHWCADLGWYTLVSCSIHRGRRIMSERAYRAVLFLCGVFLIVFGGYYLFTAVLLPSL
jgi:threonine/homoserine/homoserine lactone efflux protein